jgi:hypothetical protein
MSMDGHGHVGMEHADHGATRRQALPATSRAPCPVGKCGYCSLLFNCPALPVACHSPHSTPARQYFHPTSPAWAMPGKPSSPAPAPAPRPSSRKHPPLISHVRQPQLSRRQVVGRVVYDCSMEIVMSRFSADSRLSPAQASLP